jgi:ketosteroid isomerase-like protein
MSDVIGAPLILMYNCPMWGRGKVATARKFFDALGAGDVPACAALLADDVRYIDTRGNAIEGREACVELLRRLFARGEVRIAVDSIAARAGYALARGRTVLKDEVLAGEVLWRIRTAGERIVEVEAHRPDALPTARLLMPEYLDAKAKRTPAA